MSISEARRQIEIAIDSVTEVDIEQRAFANIVAHGFTAIVEVLASNAPYDGDLNAIRVPNTLLRQISIDMVKSDTEDIGLEDLIVAIRARLRSSDLDNTQ